MAKNDHRPCRETSYDLPMNRSVYDNFPLLDPFKLVLPYSGPVPWIALEYECSSLLNYTPVCDTCQKRCLATLYAVAQSHTGNHLDISAIISWRATALDIGVAFYNLVLANLYYLGRSGPIKGELMMCSAPCTRQKQ